MLIDLPAAFTIKHKGDVKTVVVDSSKLDDVSEHKWSISTCAGIKYVVRSTSIKGGAPKRTVYLHRQLLGVFDTSVKVDHINGDTLDNRLENLRAVSSVVNILNRTRLNSNNTSGVRGVAWSSQKGAWRARVKVRGREVHLGFFNDLSAAQRVIETYHSRIKDLSDKEVNSEDIRNWCNTELRRR